MKFPPSRARFSLMGRRVRIVGAVLLGAAALFLPVAFAGEEDRQRPLPELLGSGRKSVSRILGEGEPLAGGLFNEEWSEIHSGGIGSTHAYRTRIGYLRGASCYAFFMKKTGEAFSPIEVIGLLYLCANRADWRELEMGGGTVGLIHRAADPKGKGGGRTYLATLDESARRLFVYSPEWRPDFSRELWVTPDEAPEPMEPERWQGKGSPPERSDTKQVEVPDLSSFGKSSGASDGKGRGSDPKEGVYLPKLDQVVPLEPDSGSNDAKASPKGKRNRRDGQGKQAKPAEPASSK